MHGLKHSDLSEAVVSDGGPHIIPNFVDPLHGRFEVNYEEMKVHFTFCTFALIYHFDGSIDP